MLCDICNVVPSGEDFLKIGDPEYKLTFEVCPMCKDDEETPQRATALYYGIRENFVLFNRLAKSNPTISQKFKRNPFIGK